MKLSPSPFSPAEERVLAYLRRKGPVTQVRMLEDLGVASAAVQGLLREGFVEKVRGRWRLAP